MRFIPTLLDDAWLIELELHEDERGFFSRVFCRKEFQKHGLNSHIAQMNFSHSKHKYTLRGFHYQQGAAAEAKTVRCIRGRILDVIIDLRPESRSRYDHFQVELSARNRRALYVPEGFAHAFLSLEPDSEVLYTVSHPYEPEMEEGIRWDDPFFAIPWPVGQPILSEKDAGWPDFMS